MTKLLPLILISTLVACGGSGNDNNDGGAVTPPTTPPVNPPGPTHPPEGKRLSTKCDGTTVVREFADGKGGSYFEREENFEKCGYVPLSVEVVKREGDYFKPVIIKVTGTDEWDFDIEAGNAKRTETGIEITSDGQVGTWVATIAGEQYEYELVPPPVCEAPRGSGPRPSKTKIDCEGHEVGLRSSPMIWYGEEDEQIVDIEISVVRTASRCPDNSISQPENGCKPGTLMQRDNPEYQLVVDSIDNMNKFNLRSGVWVRFVLVGVYWGPAWSDIYSFNPSVDVRASSDIVLGWGAAGGAGGQAFMPVSIYEGMVAPRPVSTTMGNGVDFGGTALHEIGHAMSLGHGVWGVPDWQGPEIDPLGWQGGSIFSWFGHGWSGKSGEGICGHHGTVMSYSSKVMWSNSKLRCSELTDRQNPNGYPQGNFGDMAGDRRFTDEAYALNRVRYSYSLIHNEHRNAQLAPVPYVQPPEKLPGEDDEGIYVEKPMMCGVGDPF